MNYIYRMTHIDNIPHILANGITHKDSPHANSTYVPIGNADVISKRCSREITTTDGQKACLIDFIPFYFYCRMPMLYNIQHGFNVSKVAPDDIVYLILKIDNFISDPNRQYIFSDAHAMWKMAKFYSKQSIDKIDEILDIDAIRNNTWGEDYVIREKKQAEFLVQGDIQATHINMIVCYSDTSRKKLEGMGVKCEIKVSPAAYY